MATFDPSKYIRQLKGADYLEVKWRLVWLRAEHPDASIVAELVHHAPGESAVFRAVVVLPSGASATAHGMEERRDFGDYLEKAETKAVGRALALLGFGTQFVAGDELAASTDSERPARRPAPSPAPEPAASSAPAPARAPMNPNAPATERQIRAIEAMARRRGLDAESIAAAVGQTLGVPGTALDRLTAGEASRVITTWSEQQ